MGLGRTRIQAAVQAAHDRGMNEIEVSTEITSQVYRAAGFDQEYVLMGLEFNGP